MNEQRKDRLLRTLCKKDGIEILSTLKDGEKMSFTEIKEATESTDGTTSRRLQELLDYGLVKAEGQEGCLKCWKITDKGREIQKVVMKILNLLNEK